MFAFVVLGLLVLMALAGLSGRTYDSRDPDYSLGKVLQPRSTRPAGR